ncbi:salicylaldehyde dehydrogenase [Coccidioides immitis H538.4]|uniref:Salicylaldehyde dehydrogenase n=1 Tax=Coccidioides immitis H538.4 TaxID=396776 RepID=A0A0J8RWV1_COCIT|nr:salicylaldehyde dehydrogenase [Coccidioides immitis H538.4]
MANNTVPLIVDNKDVVTSTAFDVNSPGTGKAIYQCSSATVDDATRAVDSAHTAFKSWSKTKPAVRQDIMLKAAEIYLRRKDELIGYCAEETGASGPFPEITFGIGYQMFKDVAGRAANIEGVVPQLLEDGQSAIVYRVPYGVILSIVPWNAPFPLGLRAILLPLMAGNTVVLKASELSPKTFWGIADVLREAGLPAGCLNVVYHRPADAAEITTALIAHPAVRKVNFTGSTVVGSIIASTAGKIHQTSSAGTRWQSKLHCARRRRSRQGCHAVHPRSLLKLCMSTERIIVQQAVAVKFRSALVETMKNMYHDDAPSPILINATPVAKNKKLISDAVSQGAGIVHGDLHREESSATRMKPVIIENVTPDMDIHATESFGPTVSLFVVETEEEAIALANDTEYGLTSAVFTTNLGRGLRVAKQIESGAVHINSLTIHDEPALPHGGMKKSGFGRFGGISGLNEFLTTKSVTWMDI